MYQTKRKQLLDARKRRQFHISHTVRTFCRDVRFDKWDSLRQERLFDKWLVVKDNRLLARLAELDNHFEMSGNHLQDYLRYEQGLRNAFRDSEAQRQIVLVMHG